MKLSPPLDALPAPLLILLGVLALSIGLSLNFYGARSFDLGRYAGTTRGTSTTSAYFSGGVGGVLSGLATFGVLAALAIVGVTEKMDNEVSGVGTLLVLSFASILGGIISGRYRIIGLSSLAILSSIATTLLITTTIPQIPLLGTQILLALFLPLTLLLIHLPRTTTRSKMLLSAVGGGFVVVNGIDFFVRLGVRDVVGLLVGLEGIRGGREVGGGREKGLLAGWWLLSVVGTGIQFWFGVNDVDSEWNTYLSTLIATHSTPSRTGIFTPPPSLFNRFIALFRRSKPKFTQSDSRSTRRRSTRRCGEGGRGDERGVTWDSDEEVINKGEEWNSDSEESDDDETLRESIRPAIYDKQVDLDLGPDDDGDAGKNLNLDDDDDEGDDGVDGRRSIGSKTSDRTFVTSGSGEGETYEMTSPLDSPSISSPRLPISSPSIPISSPSFPFPNSKSTTTKPNTIPATPSLLLALNRVNQAQRLARGEPPLLSPHPSSPSTSSSIPADVRSREREGDVRSREREGGRGGKGESSGGREREASEKLWDDVERNLLRSS